jgi:two-component system sensor histidine kinase HydH
MVLLRETKAVAVSARTLQSLIRYAAQLTELGAVTSGITHEIKNALNSMALHAELLGQALADGSEETRQSLEIIRREVRRLDDTTQRFKVLVRPQEVAATGLDLNALLEDVARLLEPEWRPKGTTFAVTLDPSLAKAWGDEELLRRVFLNLVLNACEAMPGGGPVTLASARDPEDMAVVTVADTGPGIAPEDVERVFELYYTTKPQGSGIGLALVRRIVEAHGGSIGIQSELGRGTSIVVRLPLGPPS